MPGRRTTMKAMIRPVCRRCGYQYDSRKDRRVLVFRCEDGDYTACERCLETVGAMKEAGALDEEIDAVIRSFKNEV
jgi:hypothetical protein